MKDEEHDEEQDDDRVKEATGLSWHDAMIVSGLALSIPGLLFGPMVLGYWLDSLFGTSPWLTLGLAFVGILGTGIDIFAILKRTGFTK